MNLGTANGVKPYPEFTGCQVRKFLLELSGMTMPKTMIPVWSLVGSRHSAFIWLYFTSETGLVVRSENLLWTDDLHFVFVGVWLNNGLFLLSRLEPQQARVNVGQQLLVNLLIEDALSKGSRHMILLRQ